MKTNTDNHKTARAAIQKLRTAATLGDAEAAELLLDIATRATNHLGNLATHPTGSPGRAAIDTAAARAESWPVTCPAIDELRLSKIGTIPKSLGAALPIRVNKGKTKLRDFTGGSQCDLALTAFDDIQRERQLATPEYRASLAACWHSMTDPQKQDWQRLAVMLPDLDGSKATLDLWKNAGVRWAEAQCEGRWKSFPWSAEVLNRAEQRTTSRKRGIEAAVREKLGRGFAVIARTLIRGE